MAISSNDLEDAHRLDAQLISDLWVFRSAARFSSITGAARNLNVTQGAVSQRVLRLEARLATALFIRKNGGVSLTEDGKALLQAMTEVASILNSTLSSMNRRHKGAIVVGCMPSLATEWLVPHLEDFYLEHPGVEVFVRSELMPVSAERMEDEGIDLTIDYSPYPAEGLHELASIQEFLFPVCSRAYREALERDLDPESTVVLLHDDVPWIGGKAGDEWNAWRKGSDVNWPIRDVVDRHFNLAHLAYHAAMCGQGIAVGRSTVVNRLMAKGELIEACDLPPVPGPMFRVLTHRSGAACSLVRQFADWWSRAIEDTSCQTLSLLRDARHKGQ